MVGSSHLRLVAAPSITSLPAPGLTKVFPEVFDEPEFLRWLERWPEKFTWKSCVDSSQYTDVIVLVHPALTGVGSEGSMPH